MMTSNSESNTAKTINSALRRVEFAQRDLIAIQETDLGIKSKRLACDVKDKLERTTKSLEATKRLLIQWKNRDDALIRAIRGEDDDSVQTLDSDYLEKKLISCRPFDENTLKDEFAVIAKDMITKSRSSNKQSKSECKDNNNSEDASVASDDSSLASSIDSDIFRREVTFCNITEDTYKEELAALKNKSLTKANQPRSSQTDDKSVNSDKGLESLTTCNLTADTSRDYIESKLTG